MCVSFVAHAGLHPSGRETWFCIEYEGSSRWQSGNPHGNQYPRLNTGEKDRERGLVVDLLVCVAPDLL